MFNKMFQPRFSSQFNYLECIKFENLKMLITNGVYYLVFTAVERLHMKGFEKFLSIKIAPLYCESYYNNIIIYYIGLRGFRVPCGNQ